MKTCTKCGVEKPLSEYHKDPKGKGGLRAYCKICNVAMVSEWQKANRDRVNAKSKRYYFRQKAKREAADV